MSWY